MDQRAVIYKASYAELLAGTLPKVIESDEENQRIIAELERLDSLPSITPEEQSLAELLTMLAEQFERRYEPEKVSPLECLKAFMEDRSLRQRDLIPVFGSSSVASDVINGKRPISKQHARKLAEFFSAPVSLFI